MPDRGPGRDDFDDIVQRLDLELSFPDDPPSAPAVRHPSQQDEPHDPADDPDPVDEQFYRRVPQGPARPWHRGRVLAWAGVAGSPTALVLATLAGVWVGRAVLLCAGLTFVAGAIYLVSQLPEHGPAQRDWPDDGAEL